MDLKIESMFGSQIFWFEISVPVSSRQERRAYLKCPPIRAFSARPPRLRFSVIAPRPGYEPRKRARSPFLAAQLSALTQAFSDLPDLRS
jgi:hypothetical protein